MKHFIAVLFFCPWFVCAKPLLVFTEHWPPYNYLDKNGEVTGISTDKVKNWLSSANVDYSLQLMPWTMAYSKSLNRPNTLIYTIYRTPEREPNFHWFCPLIETGSINVYSLKDRGDIQIRSLSDIKKYRLALSSRTVSYEYLVGQGLVPNTDFQVTSDEEASIRLLINRRVDLIVQEHLSVDSYMKNENASIEDLRYLYTLIPPEIPKCAALSIESDPKLVETLQRSFASS